MNYYLNCLHHFLTYSETLTNLKILNQSIHLKTLQIHKIFQKKIAYGKRGFPWKGLNNIRSKVSYSKGICPIAEKLNEKTKLFLFINNFIEFLRF